MPRTASFTCTECGWIGIKWVGKCPECHSWDSIIEHTAPRLAPPPVSELRRARPITVQTSSEITHQSTGMSEFDRVLGGGLVPGAVMLLSGEPGVGKSTLLLEIAARLARNGISALYVSAEESVEQVRLRARRTGALADQLFLTAENDLAAVLGQIDAIQPDFVVIDSVQTVSSASYDGSPGQPAQVREVAGTLIRVAKERSLPVILVGHVTKDGQIAGPRLLEHLVDVVLSFEGDRHTALRFVRALKNRFGPSDETGCFEMNGDGIAEVPDPSKLFLSRSDPPVSGTCVTFAREGRRVIPVEVQALVVKTGSPNPRRVVSGVDAARVSMLLAVLEKRCRIRLGDHDVYVSTVGGIRLVEPGADLAIALALASAARDAALPGELAAIGEISLAGQVRPVPGFAQRAAEARRLGYRQVIDAEIGFLSDAEKHAFRFCEPSIREAVSA